MVDEKPNVHIESTPTHSNQDTQTADLLRQSIDVKPPTAGATTNQSADASKPDAASNLSTLRHRMTDLADQTNSADTQKSLGEKLVDNSSLVRRGVAFGEGAVKAVPGALKAAEHDFSHPADLIEKAATGAVIGAGMRVLLPKTGVGKAVVGAVMGYYMVKDAAAPLIQGWQEAGKAKNLADVHKASDRIGDGVGAFAWDAAVGSLAGLKAEKWTGRALDAGLGSAKFAAFERTKVDLDAKFIGKPLEFVLSPINKAANWASEKMVRTVEDPKINFQEVKHKFAEVEAQHIADVQSVDLHLQGVTGLDGKRLGFSQTLDLLEQGHDPRNVTAEQAHNILGDPLAYAGNRVELTGDGSANATGTANGARPGTEIPISGYAKAIISHNDTPAEPTSFGNGKDAPQVPTNDSAQPPAGDNTGTGSFTGADTKGGDKNVGNGATGPGGKPYVTKAELEVNAVNYGKLAGMNKAAMDGWADKRVLIADAIERLVGPVHAAITPEYKKMDAGYILVRNEMIQIAAQIKTDKDFQYVNPLFTRLAMAATQHVSDGLSETAALKYQLDLMALETHSELVRNMKKAGIDSDVVLQSKNPAVFSISHDGGAGPHTMRQIVGVWDVDHVLYPRNMVDTRSTTASGIYGHELGHDQYGGIAKFDESVREQVISDAINKGLGARANETIDVPGAGKVTKKVLIEAIFKAQADENTADIWGAAWTGHNSGGALGILLQSMRKGGQLETRNVFGTEFKSPENPFGFEVHAFDALRPKIVAAVMRARAGGDARTIELADALDRYSDEASKGGDYVFANMDTPGQTITIPRKDMEDVIPHLIDAQLNTKLSALQGHSMAEILPDLPANLAKMDILADLMVDAITKNKKPSDIPFDVSQYKMIQVFGAGLPAASRLVAQGMDATEANEQVNAMSDYLRGLYHANDPHVDPLKPSALQTIRLTSPKSLLAGTAQGARDAVHSTGQVLAKTPQLGDWLANRALPYTATVGVVGIDKNYRHDITAQSLSQIDMSPNASEQLATGGINRLDQRASVMKDFKNVQQVKQAMQGAAGDGNL